MRYSVSGRAPSIISAALALLLAAAMHLAHSVSAESVDVRLAGAAKSSEPASQAPEAPRLEARAKGA